MDSTATFIAYLGLHNRPVIESGGDTWTGERIPIEKFIIVFIIIIKEINNIC